MENNEPFNVVEHLLAKGFETRSRLAQAVGRATNTISDWSAANSISHKNQVQILTAAQALGIPVYPDDFFEPDLRKPV